MTVSALCTLCRPLGFPFSPDAEPSHCYGATDWPGLPGLIGSGFRCTCPCRDREQAA